MHQNVIQILGQKIVLKSSEKDPEVVDQVIELVAKRIEKAELRSKSRAPHQVAVLALLDLAEEYLGAKRRVIELKRQMDMKSDEILSLTETELK